jgi:lysophospholipase L1-like esterase
MKLHLMLLFGCSTLLALGMLEARTHAATPVPNITPRSGCIIGDSSSAAYAGGTRIADFLYTSAQTAAGWKVNSLAVPGHTIAQQKAVYLADSNKATYDYTIVQIGGNDLKPEEPASAAISRLQDLINTVNAHKKPKALTIISTMLPNRQRLMDIHGAINGPIAYQKFLDINNAIKGGGPTPITGVDCRISCHTALLNDGNGNLAAAYDTGDHTHENNAARQIIARIWNDALATLFMIQD